MTVDEIIARIKSIVETAKSDASPVLTYNPHVKNTKEAMDLGILAGGRFYFWTVTLQNITIDRGGTRAGIPTPARATNYTFRIDCVMSYTGETSEQEVRNKVLTVLSELNRHVYLDETADPNVNVGSTSADLDLAMIAEHAVHVGQIRLNVVAYDYNAGWI